MTFYRRNLPHWHPEGASIFLTWRLYGSLPVGYRAMLEERKSTARNGCATKDSPGRRFKLLDSALDKSTTGLFWLKSPRIARCVVEVIRKGDSVLSYFILHAFVVMPNHVHLLITPKVPIPRIMNGIKGAAARQANAILSRKGKHFWQDESFDHWVRTSKEFDRIHAYIEYNPVFAGLATKPEDWPWSSASLRDGKSGWAK
jgi:REP-associated tyrosine transposase